MQGLWKVARYAAIASAVVFAQVPTSHAQGPFVIEIKTAESSFKSGAEIKLQISLTNTSDHDIVATKGKGDAAAEDAGYMVEAWDTEGNHPPETTLLRALTGKEESSQPIISSSVLVPLSPGQSVTNGMIANKFYYLSKAGKYRIQVQRRDPLSGITIKSNVISITVAGEVSEHPCRLPSGQRCEDILN